MRENLRSHATKSRRHAVVLGASMGGLLAARALSDSYERVTLVERDELRQEAAHRRGVPQGRHVHALLVRGRRELEKLLPGLVDEAVARGALIRDVQQDGRYYADGHLLEQAPTGLEGILLSRPLLESIVRARVLALPTVELLAPSVLVDIEQAQGRVTGVRVRRVDDGVEQQLAADLVVDATGRGSHTPTWLSSIGFPRPVETVYEVALTYRTVLLDHEPGDLRGEDFVLVAPSIALPRVGAAVRQEGKRWIVTLAGYGADAPPEDLAGLRAFAATLPGPEIAELLAKEPLDDPVTFRYQRSTWRHYERLRRFPDGFLVFGDAICSFNPLYGQGMSVAAAEAAALQQVLAEGDLGVSRRFFRHAAKALKGPWEIAAASDLRLPVVPGKGSVKVRVTNRYVARVQAAAAADARVGRSFLEVANLLAPPESLLRPTTVARVLRAGGARSAPIPAQRGVPAPEAATTPRGTPTSTG